jgi:hypothetical protein
MKMGYVAVAVTLLLITVAVNIYDNAAGKNNNELASSTVWIRQSQEINTTISMQYGPEDNNSVQKHHHTGHKNVKTKSYLPDNSSIVQTPLSSPTPLVNVTDKVSPFKTYEISRIGYHDMQDGYKGSKRLKIGPEAGIQTNLRHGSLNPGASRSGFHAGAVLNIPFNRHFALQPGLMFNQQSNLLKNGLSFHPDEALTTHSLDFPASIVYKFGSPDNCRLLIGVSPYVSLLLSVQDKVEISGPAEDNLSSVSTISRDRLSIAENSLSVSKDEVPKLATNNTHGLYETDNINKLDWGIGAFAGFEIPAGLYIKAEVQAGLRNANAYQEPTDRGYEFLLSIGYFFHNDKSTE